jgi:hypothetical protein
LAQRRHKNRLNYEYQELLLLQGASDGATSELMPKPASTVGIGQAFDASSESPSTVAK